MQGLDYIATDGAQAFDDLNKIVESLISSGDVDSKWRKDIEQKLKMARRYLKIDYKCHLSVADACSDHCMTLA